MLANKTSSCKEKTKKVCKKLLTALRRYAIITVVSKLINVLGGTEMEYWVEYGFVDTPYGKRPMFIRIFKNESDAWAFSDEYDDANIIGVTKVEL